MAKTKPRTKSGKIRIGVLDIQGSVEEHLSSVSRLGACGVPVKMTSDLDRVDALILPGGESTSIGLLCEKFGLRDAIVRKIRSGLPVYGTCAGAILLAKWGLLNIDVERNAYGRQIESFNAEILCDFFPESIRALFIRAPKFIRVHDGVKILARYENDPVLVQQGSILASSFHPELTDDLRIHQYFLSFVSHA